MPLDMGRITDPRLLLQAARELVARADAARDEEDELAQARTYQELAIGYGVLVTQVNNNIEGVGNLFRSSHVPLLPPGGAPPWQVQVDHALSTLRQLVRCLEDQLARRSRVPQPDHAVRVIPDAPVVPPESTSTPSARHRS